MNIVERRKRSVTTNKQLYLLPLIDTVITALYFFDYEFHLSIYISGNIEFYVCIQGIM